MQGRNYLFFGMEQIVYKILKITNKMYSHLYSN